MAIIFKPRKSTLAGAVPTTSQLQDGELAVNTTDKKIFIRVGAAIVEMFKNLTKADVGLSNVDNTSDMAKPVSTATATALAAKANSTHSHSISDVTELQTALDGKQDAGSYAEASHITDLNVSLGDIAADAGAPTFRQPDAPAPDLEARRNLYRESAWYPTTSVGLAETGVPDPLGGKRAVLASVTTAGSNRYISARYTVPSEVATYAGSVWIRAGSVDKISLGILGSGEGIPSWAPRGTFTVKLEGPGSIPSDPATGLILVSDLSQTEWTKLELTRDVGVAGAALRVAGYPDSPSEQEVGESVYLFGNQLELGTEHTPYQETRSDTDFDGSGLPVGSIWYQTDANDDVIATHRWDGSNWIDVTHAIDLTGAYTWTGAHTFTAAVTGSVSGNAGTATKLQTSRTVQVNLVSTSAVGFDGSANITPGVTGVLPVTSGGTGANNAAYARTSLGVPSATGSGASGTWAIAVTGNSAGLTAATNLRGVKPNTSGQSLVASVKAYFASKEMLEGAAAGTSYGDFLLLDTYSDGSGGMPNGLFFDKKSAQPAIYHYRGAWDGESWDAPLKLSYDGHAHAISDVTGLQAALDGKQPAGSYAPAVHTHAMGSISGLDVALANKAHVFHSHYISEVTGLQSALDGKQDAGSYAPASHTHTIANVTGLQSALDGKQPAGSYAPASHTHTIANVSGLQSALDGKASASHTHSQSDVTNLVGDLAAKAPTASPTFSGVVGTTGLAFLIKTEAEVIQGRMQHNGTNLYVSSDVGDLLLRPAGFSTAANQLWLKASATSTDPAIIGSGNIHVGKANAFVSVGGAADHVGGGIANFNTVGAQPQLGVFAGNGAGNAGMIYLRPDGRASAVGQSSFGTTAANIGTPVNVSGNVSTPYFAGTSDNPFRLGYGSTVTHGYISWHTTANTTTRTAYAGFGSAGSTEFMVNNEAGGPIHLQSSSVYVRDSGGVGMALEPNGHIWVADANNRANRRRQPRIFVQSGDPGAAAFDNDLWVW